MGESEVNKSVSLIRQYETDIGKNIFGIGKELYNIKQIKKGDFTIFCKENLMYSLSTAHNYMRVFKRFGSPEYDSIRRKFDSSSLMMLSKKKYDDQTVNDVFQKVENSEFEPCFTKVHKYLNEQGNKEIDESAADASIAINKTLEKLIKKVELVTAILKNDSSSVNENVKINLVEKIRCLQEEIERIDIKKAA